MVRVKIGGARRYECFECGDQFVVPYSMHRCVSCDEEENFYLMD